MSSNEGFTKDDDTKEANQNVESCVVTNPGGILNNGANFNDIVLNSMDAKDNEDNGRQNCVKKSGLSNEKLR